MAKYDHQLVEDKWQKIWQTNNYYQADNSSVKPKKYILDMFPYPSGAGLHVGHVESYTAADIISRYFRLKGFEVLHPMGWDSFGLPAENYAIKKKIHPKLVTEQNINRFRQQLKRLGCSYDWSREVATSDPQYYRWTQWIFLKLFAQQLAYQAVVPINWCPSCQTGLANEEVIDGACERCQTIIIKKQKKQWLLKITDYADRLLADLDSLTWPTKIKTMQANWIGRSVGAYIKFKLVDDDFFISVFSTRSDTLFGVTYLVVAPEYAQLDKLIKLEQRSEVGRYVEKVKTVSEYDRADFKRKKTGVFTGSYAINPATNEPVPIWVADYVLASYGTGAVMAVPAHDERDFAFAQKFGLPERVVIVPDSSVRQAARKAYLGEGRLVDSGQFTRLSSEQARKQITDWLKKQNLGQPAVNYKLKDWLFSRQRYWGEPIPIIHCLSCGAVPVPVEDLPVTLPEVEFYQPSGTGESPLATITDWVETVCPKCGKSAKRETDTMPQWAGSSWYWLRFCDPNNSQELFDSQAVSKWAPVDIYVGGAEHAVLHLLYARFWHKVLYDQGLVNHQEPFLRLVNQGIILAADGRKMSKSFDNVVNPDEVIEQWGADCLRLFEMFLGPLEDAKPWQERGIVGLRRFLEKIWNLGNNLLPKEIVPTDLADQSAEFKWQLNLTIKKTTEDIESFRFNTAISGLMEFTNYLTEDKNNLLNNRLEGFKNLLILLYPLAPHITSELWQLSQSQFKWVGSLAEQVWPTYQAAALQTLTTVLAIQVNGKLRGQLNCSVSLSKEEIINQAKVLPGVQKYLANQTIKKTIYVADKIVNFVID
ncbi:leucine--tRNA ligase [Patescibacteria group bacterium]|nr:leucine--tRNA ligase [Patescibacteria group bacterium]